MSSVYESSSPAAGREGWRCTRGPIRMQCISPCTAFRVLRWLSYIRRRYSLRPVAPLTPAVLHILMVLAQGERHGYAIMKQVEIDSGGRVKMGPGTLYGSLKRMLEAGLVQESDRRDPEDERRVYYRITAAGQKALDAELQRYREVVALANRTPRLHGEAYAT